MNNTTLSTVCDLIAGFAFKSNHFGSFSDKAIKITNINPPIVQMDDLVGIDISQYNRQKLTKFIARRGDYVLAMTGATIGKLGKVLSGEAYINQRVLLFRPLTDKIDKQFLFYVLSHPNFNKFIYNHVDSETAQPNISAATIGKYEFALPDLPMQRQIASVLSALDSKIELNTRINKNLSYANDNVAFNLREAA